MTPKEAVQIYLEIGFEREEIARVDESEHFFYIYNNETFENGTGIFLPFAAINKRDQTIKTCDDEDEFYSIYWRECDKANIIPEEIWDEEKRND